MSETCVPETDLHRDTIHSVADLKDCPFIDLTRENWGKTWTISRGGLGLDDSVWHIDIFKIDPKGNTFGYLTAWPLPSVFGVLFEHFESMGDRRRLGKIKAAFADVSGGL